MLDGSSGEDKGSNSSKVPPGLSPHILPGILKEVAEAAGMKAAIDLCENARGSCLYIPRLENIHRSRRFIACVGREAAEKIAKVLGGDIYNIPSCRPVLRAYRARILKTAGYTHAQIALLLDMDKNHARRLAPTTEYPVGEIDPGILSAVFDNVPARFAGMKPNGYNNPSKEIYLEEEKQEQHPLAPRKIRRSQIDDIRLLKFAGYSVPQISSILRISQRTIYKKVNNLQPSKNDVDEDKIRAILDRAPEYLRNIQPYFENQSCTSDAK